MGDLMDVSIVIPTKNAGDGFEEVLNSIFAQATDLKYEVICVDSGSSDSTLEIIAKYPVRLYEIPPQDFGHGKTRNYGASKARGEYIVFITQDALPASNTWLDNFVRAMSEDDQIAGGFGIHYPYPDCNLFDKRDIKAHFDRFGKENRVMYIDDQQRWLSDESYMHELCFFSDNNSCVKRSVFEKHPYPDVEYAEDQIWMRQMLELGYKKVYCPAAPVFHSHNYRGRVLSKRFFDEYKGLYEIHGYLIAERKLDLVRLFKDLTISDIRYVRSQKLSKRQKLASIVLSLSRNYRRCFAGYLGGQYHLLTPDRQSRLDSQMSQQKEQREA